MVNIGMIGYNDGNGHPFSFSAIINGYDDAEMKKCPYKVIYNYLSEREESDFSIGNLRVTHVWTPNFEMSTMIAKACLIPNIVDDYKDLAGKVDAIIIARDDVESHNELARFFLEKGLPVFVDKPLCDNTIDLEYFMKYIECGQLMSCSGLRYHPDIQSRYEGKLNVRDICFVNTFSVLDWKKYGIHVLEAITPIMGSQIEKIETLNEGENTIAKISYKSGKYAIIQITTNCMNLISAEFYTIDNTYKTIFNQNFVCFKRLLEEFSRMIKTQKPVIDPLETYFILKTIIEGDQKC